MAGKRALNSLEPEKSPKLNSRGKYKQRRRMQRERISEYAGHRTGSLDLDPRMWMGSLETNGEVHSEIPVETRQPGEPIWVQGKIPDTREIFLLGQNKYSDACFVKQTVWSLVDAVCDAGDGDTPLMLVHKIPVDAGEEIVKQNVEALFGKIDVLHMFLFPKYPFCSALIKFVEPGIHLWIAYLGLTQKLELAFKYHGIQTNIVNNSTAVKHTPAVIESAYTSPKLNGKLLISRCDYPATGRRFTLAAETIMRFFHHNFGPINLTESWTVLFPGQFNKGVFNDGTIAFRNKALYEAAIAWRSFFVGNEIEVQLMPRPASEDTLELAPSKIVGLSGWRMNEAGVQTLENLLRKADPEVLIEKFSLKDLFSGMNEACLEETATVSALPSGHQSDNFWAVATFTSEYLVDLFLSRHKMIEFEESSCVLMKKISVPCPLPNKRAGLRNYFPVPNFYLGFYCDSWRISEATKLTDGTVTGTVGSIKQDVDMDGVTILRSVSEEMT